MLQRWRKSDTIAMTPEGVVLKSGGKTTALVDSQHYASWSQLLTALEHNASSIGTGPVRFILSNHYVRYAILPWQSGVFAQQDWQSLAENHMRTLYGSEADNWTIDITMQGYGNSLIISAIDQLFLMRLSALATQYKWTISSIEPALMTVTNRYRGEIGKNDWLFIAEPQRLLLAEVVDDVFVNVSVICPTTDNESAESINLLQRTLQQYRQNKSIKVHLFGQKNLALDTAIDKVNINSLAAGIGSDKSMATLLVESR